MIIDDLNKMTVAGVVILYYPEIEELSRNINSYTDHISKIFIVCNSPCELALLGITEIERIAEIEIIQNPTNFGIAKALNQAVVRAIREGFDWILTMDQDSSFSPNGIRQYLSLISDYSDNAKYSIFCPNFLNSGSTTFFCDVEVEEVKEAITSGSVIRLKLFDEIGFFREDFFIDGVDFEFCYRAKTHHYRILRFNNIHLNHTLGYTSKTRWGFSTLNYSYRRTYFISRNHLILWRMYPHYYSFKRTYIKEYIIFRIIKILISEKAKFLKIYYLLKGVLNGFFFNKTIRKWQTNRND